MSSRFHNKWHRSNHHTYQSPTNADAGHDPIASFDSPFQGDFVIQGGINLTVPSTSAYSAVFNGSKVGINTSNPTATLQVNGDTLINYDLSANGNAYIGGNTIINGNTLIYGNLSALGKWTELDTYVNVTSAVTIENFGTGPALQVTQLGPQPVATFYDDTYPTLYINQKNVGIGTIPNAQLNGAPYGQLQVQGSVYANYYTSAGSNQTTNRIQGAGVEWNRNNGDGNFWITNNSGTNPSGGFIFAKIDNSNQIITKPVYIAGDTGNVGIGTTTPNTKLTVSGAISATDASTLTVNSASPALLVQQYGTGNSFRVDDTVNHTSPFVVDANGNVGIGTLTPSVPLHVNGGNLWVQTPYQYGGLVVKNGSNTVGYITGSTSTNDNGSFGLLNNGANGVSILASGKSYFNGGNVGIGTINPNYILDIQGGDVNIGSSSLSFPSSSNKLLFNGILNNTDSMYIHRYNVASDISEFRINVGDNAGHTTALASDYFVVGNYIPDGTANWNDWLRLASDLASFSGSISAKDSITINYPSINPVNLPLLNVYASSQQSVYGQIQNLYSGVSASTDLTIYNNLGNYLDIGIASSTYDGSKYSPKFDIVNSNDSYVYSTSANLALGSATGNVTVFAGGTTKTNKIASFNSDGTSTFTGNITSSGTGTFNTNVTIGGAGSNYYGDSNNLAVRPTSGYFCVQPPNGLTTAFSVNPTLNSLIGAACFGSNGSFNPNTLVTIGSTNNSISANRLYIAGYGNNLGYGIIFRSASDSATVAQFLNASGTQVGYISTSGATTTYGTNSDYRLKTNFEPLTGALNRISELPVYRFNWLNNLNGNKVDGFIAHEAQTIIPEAVTGEKDAVNEDGSINPQGIDQSKIVPLLAASIKELLTIVQSQSATINDLQDQINSLSAKIIN